MDPAFVIPIGATETVTYSMTGEDPGMPASNLADPQPRHRARAPAQTVGITVTLPGLRAVDCVAVLSTNLTPSANYRVMAGAWNTFDLPASTSSEANGNLVVVRPAGPVTVSSLDVYLEDFSLGALDIGLVVVGQMKRANRGMHYGMLEGRRILDRRDANPFTGAEFPVPALRNPRTISFMLSMRADAAATAEHRQLVYQLGAAKDVLFIPDINDTQAELNLRAIYSAVALPGEDAVVERASAFLMNRRFMLRERL